MLSAPVWYGGSDGTTSYKYPFDSPCTCTADIVGEGLFQTEDINWDRDLGTFLKKYVIEYSSLAVGVSNTDEVTVTCRYWRNPILPEITQAYFIETQDFA